MNKEIEKAKEDLQFFNEGDYITREMSNSARILEEYIKQLEFNLKASKKEHEHDLVMIDAVKGNAVKLLKENREIKEVLDKVTDKLKEDIEKFDKLRKTKEMYSPSEERLSAKYFYAQEILEIIKLE